MSFFCHVSTLGRDPAEMLNTPFFRSFGDDEELKFDLLSHWVLSLIVLHVLCSFSELYPWFDLSCVCSLFIWISTASNLIFGSFLLSITISAELPGKEFDLTPDVPGTVSEIAEERRKCATLWLLSVLVSIGDSDGDSTARESLFTVDVGLALTWIESFDTSREGEVNLDLVVGSLWRKLWINQLTLKKDWKKYNKEWILK